MDGVELCYTSAGREGPDKLPPEQMNRPAIDGLVPVGRFRGNPTADPVCAVKGQLVWALCLSTHGSSTFALLSASPDFPRLANVSLKGAAAHPIGRHSKPKYLRRGGMLQNDEIGENTEQSRGGPTCRVPNRKRMSPGRAILFGRRLEGDENKEPGSAAQGNPQLTPACRGVECRGSSQLSCPS